MSSLDYLHELTDALNLRDAEILRRKEELERILDSCPDMFFAFSGEVITDCNRQASIQLGWSREQLVGKSYLSFVVDDEVDRTRAAHVTQQGAKHDGSLWFTNSWRTANGDSVVVSWSGWLDEEGRTYSFGRVQKKEEGQ